MFCCQLTASGELNLNLSQNATELSAPPPLPISKSYVRFCTYLRHPSKHLKPGFCGESLCLPISIYRTAHSAFYAHKNIINSTHTHSHVSLTPTNPPSLISALIRSSPHITASPALYRRTQGADRGFKTSPSTTHSARIYVRTT
jgi:hypothetical protein